MKALYLLIPILLFASCDRPDCNNTNPVFDQYPPTANEYKAELVKQINNRGKDKLNYWIQNYIVKNGREYMMVWVQDDELCANAAMDITGNTRLQQYRKVKGVSYSGAELSGLHYDIMKDSNDTYQFIFNDVDDIVD